MAAAAAIGLVLGIGLGLALGGNDETDPITGLRDARSSLQQAAGLLDIVTVEYPQGVEDGRVVSDPEYQGARRAIERSRELYGEARPVVAFDDPALATRLDHDYRDLAGAAARRAPEADVAAQARALGARVRTAVGAG